jgi:hypothetical protein
VANPDGQPPGLPQGQEIWLETVGLHRKEDPGDYRLRTKVISSVPPPVRFFLVYGRGLPSAPHHLLLDFRNQERAELVVVNGQLVTQLRASLGWDQPVRSIWLMIQGHSKKSLEERGVSFLRGWQGSGHSQANKVCVTYDPVCPLPGISSGQRHANHNPCSTLVEP